jgi:hypothetical protein
MAAQTTAALGQSKNRWREVSSEAHVAQIDEDVQFL